ncbi:MAG TPA: shikimate kinase [Longimicrobiales bacterium]|nr:shikimate kinase [Longimicrobiales bacterium]
MGPLVARRLGWEFIDVDDAIVAQTGSTVAQLFRDHGEAAFRQLEAELTAGLSSRHHVVLSPGGGWAAQPGSLENLPAGTATIWLRVSPEEALRRLGGSPVERPLLAGADPLGALRSLAEQRTERYTQADLVIDVEDRAATDITGQIIEWLERSTS